MKTMGLIKLGALAAAIAGCAPQVETKAVTAELPPMEQRLPVVGDTKVWDRDGEQVTSRTTAFNGGAYTLEQSNGCIYSEPGGFAPSTTWSNCAPFTDGTQTSEAEGSIYPLKVGNTMSFAVKGSNANGDEWETTRVCTVKGTANVTVPAGTYDTYHVTCNDQFTDRDFYMSPELGTAVLFRRLSKSRNETLIQKMVSFDPGTGT